MALDALAMHCSSISSIAWSLQCPGHCQSAPVLKMELCGTGRRLTERMWASGIGAVTASLLMRRPEVVKWIGHIEVADDGNSSKSKCWFANALIGEIF